MRTATVKLLLSFATFAMAVAGCNCPTTVPSERKLTVAITDPKEGATFDVGADLRVVVEAKAVDQGTGEITDFMPAGGTLQVDGADTALQPVLEQGKLTFTVVGAAAGAHKLQVFGVTEEGSALGAASSEAVNVTVSQDVTPPEITRVLFENDANQDNKLNLIELPLNAKVFVQVDVSGLEDGQPVRVGSAPNGNPAYGTATALAGKARVALDTLPAVPQATYHLAAVATDKAGNASAATGVALFSLQVDQVPPTLTVISPTKVLFGLSDDADATTAGFQFRVGVNTPDSDVSRVDLSVDGKSDTCAAATCLSSGSGLLTVDLDVPGTRTGPMVVTAYDGAGNPSAPQSPVVTFDFDPPVLTITAPLASGNPHTQFTQTLSATVTDPNGGSALDQLVRFTRVPAAGAEVAIGQAAVDAAGLATTTATFANGTYDIRARVSDKAGNPAALVTETGVVVNATGCDVVFTAPATKPAYLSKSDDLDTITADLQYNIRAHSNACRNTVITLFRDAANPMPMVTSAAGDANWTVSIPSGTYTFRVDINNLAGGPTQDSIDVTVDLSGPALTQPLTGSTLQVAQDGDRQTAGVQRPLSYTATVPSGGRLDVCSNQSPAPVGAVLCADGVAGWWTLKANAAASEPVFTFPDGSYSIKPVIVSGTSTNTGAAVALIVDSIRPTTTSVTVVGDANADARLNLAELAGGSPKVTVVTSEPTTVFIRDRGTAVARSATLATGAGNSVTLDLTLTAPEADHDLEVVLRDLNANPNVLAGATVNDPLDTNAAFTLRVDRVAPSCSLTAPTRNQLGVADDSDGTTTGYQVRAGVSTSSDVGTNGVVVSVSGAVTLSATKSPSGGQVTHDFTVLPSGTNIYAIAASCTDESGNAATATPFTNLTVDLDVPTCSLTAPADASTHGTFTIATSAAVGGPGTPGLPVKIFTTPQAGVKTEVGSLTVSAGGVASGNVTYPDGAQTVVAEVTDLAGNLCTSAASSITVNAVGCPLSIASPGNNSFLNKSDDLDPTSATTLQFNVTGSSTACTAKTVRIYRLSPRTLLATGATDGASAFSIQVSLGEGPVSLEAEIDNGAAVLTSAFVNAITVDLTNPGVGSVSPTGATLFMVAQGNANVPANPAYLVDESPGAPANVTVSVNGVTGALGGSVRVLYQGAVVGGPNTVVSDPESFSIPTTLAHSSAGALVIEVRDQAGNLIRPTNAAATVDVVAPAVTTVVQTIGQARTATVDLSWGAVYDDGSDSTSGAVAGYDVRWTSNAIKTTTGNQTTGMSAMDYFDSAKAQAASLVPAGTLGYSLLVPPIATYYIAVRAKDEVGNYSAFVAPTALANNLTQAVLLNPSAVGNQWFGFVGASKGSINADAIDDLVIGAPFTSNGGVSSGAAYVYFGGAGFAAQSGCTAPNCQKLVSYDSATVANNFGYDVSIGNGADIAGENKPDVLVSAPSWSASTGRVFLFLGTGTQAALDLTAFVEFRGSAGSSLGSSARFIPDIDSPADGYSELAISAHPELSNQGRVYIFKGRSQAAWATAATGTDSVTLRKFVPLSAANVIVEGPLPVNVGGPAGNQFGRDHGGFASLGDINGDGRGDFTIPNSKDSVNKLFLFSGATVASSSLLKTGNLPTVNDAFQTLTAPVTSVGNRYGFGVAAVGGVDLIGSTLNDLVVGHGTLAKLHIFADGIASGFATPAYTSVQGASYFGYSAAVGDINGDGKLDVIAGEATTSACSTWIIYSRSGGFDGTVGSGFWQSRVQGPATSTLGATVVVGDFNGDTRADVAVGDDFDVPGRVIVWH